MRLADAYDAFLLDLDGVLFRGDEPIAGAVEALAAIREAGRRVVFVTNNSARTPAQVAEKLRGMGFDARPDEVITSALAAARVVAEDARDGAEASAFVIGEEGIRAALDEAGIEVADGDPEHAGFVVVGWDRGLTYDRLRTAAVLVRRGARLVATNADATYPAPGGELWPGAGSLLAAVEAASGARATVVGKPRRALFDVALQRVGTPNALVVGDRLETDIAGAAAAGLDAAVVFSGAARPADLLDADVEPVAALADLGDLIADLPVGRPRPGRSGDREATRRLLEASRLGPADSDDAAPTAVLEGGAGLLATASADVRGDEAYLRSVAVEPQARGRFLGVLVVAAAVRRAAGSGARTIYLLTEGAAGFFERLGFATMERADLPAWVTVRATACAETAVAMRRSVRG